MGIWACTARAIRFPLALIAAVSFISLAVPTEARAQWICSVSPTDIACQNNSDQTGAGTFTQTAGGSENVTLLNMPAGIVDGMSANTNDGNALSQNQGTVFGSVEAISNNGGNATVINSGSAFALNAQANNGGNAAAVNSGNVTTQIFVGAVNGNATATNMIGGQVGAMTTQTQGGTATTNNFGNVFVSVLTSTFFGDAVTINTGTIQNLVGPGPGIDTHTDGSGNATTINTGTVSGGISTLTGQNFGGGNATLANFGTVNGDVYVSGADAGGGTGDALLFNRGSIVADFNGVQVSTNSGNASFVNFGTVDVSNAPGFGQVVVVGSLDGNASAYNAGRIIGEIDVTGGNFGTATLSNAGLIDGSRTGGVALDMFQTDATVQSVLNLLPGSRIIGRIGLNDGTPFFGTAPTTVNFYSGGDMSSVTTFGLTCGCGGTIGGLIDTGAPVNVFGGAPFVIFGNTVAILDPTSFAVQDKNVADFSHTISSMVTSRLNNPAPMSGGSTPIGFAPSGNVAVDMARDAFAGISSLNYASTDRVLFSNPSVTAKDGTSVWAQGFAGQRIQDADAPTLRSVNNFYGGTLGADKKFRPDLRVGGLLGAGSIKSTVDMNSGDTTSNIVFGGIYGRYAMNQAFFDFALLGGHSNNDLRRNMTNNLAPGGFETASASYDGWFVSPEIAYGVRMPIAANITMTPTGRVRYLAAGFGGYQESGSTNNLTVASRTSHNFEERGEVTFTHTSVPVPSQRMQISGTLGVLALQRAGDTTVNTILLGQSLPFAAPGKNDVFGGYAGVGFDWRHISGWTVFGAAEYTATTDSSRTATAKGGVKVAF
ncbi:MAG: autotransporter outer membrane beta-barrel domain-containing protein [Afipia sp.]|nr:autotransporter outer membrane beta-barrel domain-containing protein [Afipia sp.]